MARIRTVKPEFWTSEQVMECAPMARLLFIGMWNFCDDAGIHPASVKTLKAEIFPADEITLAGIQGLIDDLLRNDLLIEYEVSGKRYWQVTGWHHQKVEKPNFKHPKPAENQGFGDQSSNGRRTVEEHSTPESSRVESKGKEENNLSVVAGSDNPSPLPPATAKQPAPTRKGLVCGLLRQAGMSDAAPHYLTDETWAQILAKRTDEEIVEVAKAKMASRPGQRTGLKYIAPALLEDPEPIAANARASPGGRISHADKTKLAASRAIFGTEIEGSGDGPGSNRIIDITPQPIPALGG